MEGILTISLVLLISFLIIKKINKERDKAISKLTLEEHPSSFKKPRIEMVSNQADHQSYQERSIPIPLKMLKKEQGDKV